MRGSVVADWWRSTSPPPLEVGPCRSYLGHFPLSVQAWPNQSNLLGAIHPAADIIHSDRTGVLRWHHRLGEPRHPILAAVEHDGLSFCGAALGDALAKYGKPGICNTDRGGQFTNCRVFTAALSTAGIQILRWMDNVFIERVWRSLSGISVQAVPLRVHLHTKWLSPSSLSDSRDRLSNPETNGIDERIFSNELLPCWQSRFFCFTFRLSPTGC